MGEKKRTFIGLLKRFSMLIFWVSSLVLPTSTQAGDRITAIGNDVQSYSCEIRENFLGNLGSAFDSWFSGRKRPQNGVVHSLDDILTVSVYLDKDVRYVAYLNSSRRYLYPDPLNEIKDNPSNNKSIIFCGHGAAAADKKACATWFMYNSLRMKGAFSNVDRGIFDMGTTVTCREN